MDLKDHIKIISGGQCGVDLTGLKVAREHDVPTGGYAPHGWKRFSDTGGSIIEDLSLRDVYGLAEAPPDPKTWPIRTAKNVDAADITIWFGHKSPGYWCTHKHWGVTYWVMNRAGLTRLPLFLDHPTESELAEAVVKKLSEGCTPVVINVAGNRLYKNPEASDLARQVLTGALRILSEKETP